MTVHQLSISFPAPRPAWPGEENLRGWFARLRHSFAAAPREPGAFSQAEGWREVQLLLDGYSAYHC